MATSYSNRYKPSKPGYVVTRARLPEELLLLPKPSLDQIWHFRWSTETNEWKIVFPSMEAVRAGEKIQFHQQITGHVETWALRSSEEACRKIDDWRVAVVKMTKHYGRPSFQEGATEFYCELWVEHQPENHFTAESDSVNPLASDTRT